MKKNSTSDIIQRAKARKLRIIDGAVATTSGEKKDKDSVVAAGRLGEMNNRYAVVRVGGKTRVVSFEESATFRGSRAPG